MRTLLIFTLFAASTHATFFGLGCGTCSGFGGGYSGYGSYGSYGGYSGGYGGYSSGLGAYPSMGSSYGGYGLPSLNTPGSYFQPVGQGAITQTLYAGQPYFTPVDSGYSSFGQSSYGSYGQSSPVYTQILPLPQNAQIVSNIPAIPQAINAQAFGGSYAQAPVSVSRVVRPTFNQIPEPAPVAPVQTGYVQPAAAVKPYAAVPHATVDANEAAPVAAPIATESESTDYNDEEEVVTAAPAIVTTSANYLHQSDTAVKKVEPTVHMINSPEEAGYRRLMKKKKI